MKDLKIVVVGQPSCKPCVVLKNQINNRLDELEEIGATFDYIDLSERDDKDAFIQKMGLTCTPTIFLMQDDEIIEEFLGYVDVDTLFDNVSEIKEEN